MFQFKANTNKVYCRLIAPRRLLCTRSSFSKSVKVSIAVENGYDRVDLCLESTASITTMSYSLSRCCQRSSMLQAIHLSFNKTALRLIVSRTPLNCYMQQETLDFVGPDLWPPNSPHWIQCWIIRSGCYAAESVWMLYEQCRWAEAAPHWLLEQSATERYWRGSQRLEKATESVRACRWTAFWTFIVSTLTEKSHGQIKKYQ